MRGNLQLDGSTHPLVAGLAGEVLIAAGGLRIDPLAVTLRGQGLLPRLRAGGGLVLRDGLSLAMHGSLAEWPSAWPVLPAPLDRAQEPTPFAPVHHRQRPAMRGRVLGPLGGVHINKIDQHRQVRQQRLGVLRHGG